MPTVTRRQFLTTTASAALLIGMPARLHTAGAAGAPPRIDFGAFVDATMLQGRMAVALRDASGRSRIGFYDPDRRRPVGHVSLPGGFDVGAIGTVGDILIAGGAVRRLVERKVVRSGVYQPPPEDADEPGVEDFASDRSFTLEVGGVFPALLRLSADGRMEPIEVATPNGEGGQIRAIASQGDRLTAWYERYPDSGIAEGYGIGAVDVDGGPAALGRVTDLRLNHGGLLFAARASTSDTYLAITDLDVPRLIAVSAGSRPREILLPEGRSRLTVGVSVTAAGLAVDLLEPETMSVTRWRRRNGRWASQGRVADIRRTVAPGLDLTATRAEATMTRSTPRRQREGLQDGV